MERLLAFNPRAALASLSAKVLMLDSSRRSLRYLARHRQRALPFRFDSYLHHTITMQLILAHLSRLVAEAIGKGNDAEYTRISVSHPGKGRPQRKTLVGPNIAAA